MRYVMLICGKEEGWFDADEAEIRAAMDKIYAWMEKWAAVGKVVDGGAELDSARTARTVRPGPDGAPVVTDGPYLELKEVVGGFIYLEAADMDEAVAIAATWPTIVTHSDLVEIRPVLSR